MPFEISPQYSTDALGNRLQPRDWTDPQLRRAPGRFQEFADAMLRGCTMTEPALRIRDGGSCYEPDATGRVVRACAYFAMAVGFGSSPNSKDGINEMRDAYTRRYGHDFVNDYEAKGLTREEIAARIAAL